MIINITTQIKEIVLKKLII